MREFGYGARRALEPYRSPDAQSYQDPNVKPFFRTFRATPEERNSLGYNAYAQQQDNMVLQEDQINQQLAAQREKIGQDKRKVARLEQVQDVEDQANEALNSGIPANQVIQQFPGLVQSPAFGRYAQMAKMATPAQQTLAPHFRKSLKSPIARSYFDKHFQVTGDATQAHDLAQADEMNDNLKVDLIKHGVPFNIVEGQQRWTPLMAQSAIQTHGATKKDNLDELGYRKAVAKYFDDMKADEDVLGKPRDMLKVKEDIDKLRGVFFPQAPVPVATPAVPGAKAAPQTKAQTPAERLAAKYGILKPKVTQP